ncbi:hypothetical protein AGMMS50276_20940 [Synergistales bacterium]|nr:hypothetical protein AGMMS50276_20940 [Synergistales bacterium]
MRSLDNLERRIAEKIVEKLDLSDIDPDRVSYSMPLFESDPSKEEKLGLDSVDGLELMVAIYEEWGIKVNPDDMPRLTTIGRIADYIREKAGGI